jgi:hypothetical protein
VGDEDFERADDLRQRDALVRLPVLCSLCIVNKDEEILVLALEVDLDLVCFAASHDCFCLYGRVLEGNRRVEFVWSCEDRGIDCCMI